MRKTVLVAFGITILALLVAAGVFVGPIGYSVLVDGFQSAGQKRALQRRSDYPQIAAAAVALAGSITNDSEVIQPDDPRVPSLLRSLSPRYISASSNHVTLEFHGGFDHYGYRVRRSGMNPARWTISWYTEAGERPLTAVSP